LPCKANERLHEINACIAKSAKTYINQGLHRKINEKIDVCITESMNTCIKLFFGSKNQ